MVGIDFSEGNLPYSDPQGLHHNQGSCLNQYQNSILEVVNILKNYDKDGMIEVLGFAGAPNFPSLSSSGEVSHFFPCSGDTNFSSGLGANGVFDLYTGAK